MDAIGKAPDEFSRAELAQAAFGKSGQQLILLANEGADGIANLREEARKYGVISNEAAADSEAYLDAQARLKAALTGITTELTSGLLPGLTESITKIADFIASIDNLEGVLTAAGYAFAGVTAGLVAFLAVAKGSAIIHGITTAFKALTTAMASNPIGVIAVVITAVLIPALIALYKNWDTVQTYLQQGLARLQFAFGWLGSVIEEGLVVAFNTVKAAAVTLVDFIYGNIIRAVGNMLEVMGKLPFVGDLFLAASEKVNTLGNAIGTMAAETRRSSAEAIQAAHEKQDAIQAELENTLTAIDTEARARRTAIEEQKKENDELVKNEEEAQEQINEIKKKALEEQIKALSERLNEIPLTEKQIQTQQIEQFTQFLKQRMKLEQVDQKDRIEWLEEQKNVILELQTLQGEEKLALQEAVNAMVLEEEQNNVTALKEILSQIPLNEQQTQNQRIEQLQQFLQQRMNLQLENYNAEETTEIEAGEKRIAWLQKQKAEILKLETLNSEQRIALEKAANDLIEKEDRRLAKAKQDLLNQQLSATSTFFNGISDLIEVAGRDNIGLLILGKATASAQALINSYLAFTQALASAPPPFNYIAATGVLAAGIAAQVKILSTPIPSAETGGRFIVPNSAGSDNTLMRVNSGEEINVTPRGMRGTGSQHITVQIEKQTIFDIVNEGITSNDILIQAANF